MKSIKRIVLTIALAGTIFSFNKIDSRAEKIIVNHDLSPGVNVRSDKSDTADILGGIDYQDIYDVKDEDDNWIKIKYQGKDAYVGKQWFFKLEDHKLIRDTELKKTRSKKSKSLKTLKKDKDKVTILEIYSDDMAKVIYKDSLGYVKLRDIELYQEKYKDQKKAKEKLKETNKTLKKYEDFGKFSDYKYKDCNFIKTRKEVDDNDYQDIQYIEQKITYEYFDVTGDGADIYWYATNFLGIPYVYGGNDLINGIDCSGFTQQVYGEFGIGLPRIAQDQYSVGYSVKLGEEKAGDLVFYGTSADHITHVAIADGKGGIIHASSPKTGIITSYIGNPYGIKRIIE